MKEDKKLELLDRPGEGSDFYFLLTVIEELESTEETIETKGNIEGLHKEKQVSDDPVIHIILKMPTNISVDRSLDLISSETYTTVEPIYIEFEFGDCRWMASEDAGSHFCIDLMCRSTPSAVQLSDGTDKCTHIDSRS